MPAGAQVGEVFDVQNLADAIDHAYSRPSGSKKVR